MEAWREECLHALLNAKSEQEVFAKMAKLAQSIGFEYCAFGIRFPVPLSRPALAIWSNYPDQWQKSYQTKGYIEVDPTVHHATKSTLPLAWSDQLFEPAREMWEEARYHGLRVGLAHPSRDGSGAVGLLTLARGATVLTKAELAAEQANVSWMTQFAHSAMSRLIAPRLAPETQVMLTAREKEVLRWTAEGKTSYEIALILAVAERTVNFHINNIMAKLRASNKTQAAVKAVALGLLL